MACLCKDFTYKKNLKLLEIEKISLSSLDNEDNKWLTFENIESIINKMDNINHQTMLDYYYDMFILDALIGNTDRHNGNWDILSDINNENSIYLCPIYDCGSSFLPLIADEDIPILNKKNVYFSICSAICDNGKRINYTTYLSNTQNENVKKALLRNLPKINFNAIYKIINDIDIISDIRKNMYFDFILERFNYILITSIENIYNIKNISLSENVQSLDKKVLFNYYKNYK